MSRKNWFLVLLALCIFAYLLILQIHAIWPFTIDDMYISLRYAKNWAHGDGLLWNIGEEPVEGYSNFSFVALAALALHWGFDPVIVLKITGFIGLCLATYALFLLSRLWFSRQLAMIPCLWFLLYSGQILWAVSGLETTVYQALLGLGLFCLLKGLGYEHSPAIRGRSQTLSAIFAGLLFCLASLTRPEAPVLIILFYSIALFDNPQKSIGNNQPAVSISVLVFLTTFVPYFLWRWHYYGYIFPNPVYCKGNNASAFLSLDKQYLSLAWPFILCALPAIIVTKDKRPYYFCLPSLVYLILLISADPVVAFANRLFLPAFMLLLPLSLAGISQLVQRYIHKNETIYPLAVAILAFTAAFIFIPKMNLSGLNFFAENPQAGQRLRKAVGNWLDENTPANSHVLLADSGMIPYFSSLKFIDSYCLNNKRMVEIPEATRYQQFCQDMLKEKPQVIILTSLFENNRIIYTPVDHCLSQKITQNNLYKMQASYQTGNDKQFYRYEIYTLQN